MKLLQKKGHMQKNHFGTVQLAKPEGRQRAGTCRQLTGAVSSGSDSQVKRKPGHVVDGVMIFNWVGDNMHAWNVAGVGSGASKFKCQRGSLEIRKTICTWEPQYPRPFS
eukprot:s824_g12.t1